MPADFISNLKARGLNVAVTKGGKLKITPASKLTASDRLYLATNAERVTRAVQALAALDDVRRHEAAERARREREEQEQFDARQERRRREDRNLWLASLDEARVEALAGAGKLSAEEVSTWRLLRDELRRLMQHQYTAYQIAAELSRFTGRPTHVVFGRRG